MNGFKGMSKKNLVVLVFMLCATGMFAQGYSIPALKTGLSIILGFFSSGYMRAILSIALGGLAMGLIANRGEPGMMKKFIPWIAACIILLSLSGITGVLFNNVGEVTTNTTWN